jgi:hypothetical protein
VLALGHRPQDCAVVLTLLFLLMFGVLAAVVIGTIIMVWLMAVFAVLAVRVALVSWVRSLGYSSGGRLSSKSSPG